VRGRSPEALLDTYTAERHPIGAWVLDWTRAQVQLMRPEAGSRALRAVVSDLIGTTAGTTYFVKRLSGVWHRYELPGGHPLVGRSVPDLELADGTRVGDHLHEGRGLLLDLGAGLAADPRVPVLAAKPVDVRDFGGLLVRPDGVVAWAGDAPDAALEEALAAWF
ncbi:FAD-dependent oxidoreductase, partial [Nonomuraea sp. NPDC001023]